MKNYLLDDKGKDEFVTEVYYEQDGTISIEFADGRIFTGILACDENLEKIAAVQEEQAKKGIANYKKFKKREGTLKKQTIANGVACAAVSTGAAFIPAINNMVSGVNPLYVAAGIGTITVLGMIPSYTKLRREKARVQEVEMLRYRAEHLDELSRCMDYPNSLSGVNSAVAKRIRESAEPFGILEMDNWDIETLTRIVGNVQLEEAFGFTYSKKA